ncbi:MAG: glycosyltransferase family 4 protein [Ferruginibacter sp.]
MKILHLISVGPLSGAEKHLRHLLPGLKKKGITCDLIIVTSQKTAGAFTDFCNELNELDVKTTLLVSGKFSLIQTAKKINRYLRTNKIDIVHSHLFYGDLTAAILKTLFNRNLYLISTKHGYQEQVLQQYEPGKTYQPNNLYYYITKLFLRKINKNLAVSKAIADLYYNIKLTKTRYPFIHHGIDIKDFNKEIFRAECRKAPKQLIIVGRIELFKGHRFLINALSIVLLKYPETVLMILGEGSEKNNCIEQVNRLGLQNNVQFLGFKPHPYSYISLSDVIILPSLFEPFGLVYIESFALKTPVVAFNTPAANEIIVNNETGLLVDKGDSKLLAEKIILLLENPEISRKITEAAFLKYKTSFTTEIMIQKTADWYLSLRI